MKDRELAVVVLAAGKGTRMHSNLPKVLHRLDDMPLITWVTGAAKTLSPARIVVVVGYGAELVERELRGEEGLVFAVQKEQLGTAHAVMQAMEKLKGFAGDVMVLSGDVPLVKPATLWHLYDFAREEKRKLAFLATTVEDPTGYGRVVRDREGEVTAIVEERDADPSQRRIREINAGLYIFDAVLLAGLLPEVRADNSQKEYYLTDVVAMFLARGYGVGALETDDATQLQGVNSPEDLMYLDRLIRSWREDDSCRV